MASHLWLHCSILRGMDAPIKLLPGQALSPSGRPRLDYRAVATLALPFMLNSAVQGRVNATDTWFIGRLSPAATFRHRRSVLADPGLLLLFGGIGLSVQTSVAQAFGVSSLHPRFAAHVEPLMWASAAETGAECQSQHIGRRLR